MTVIMAMAKITESHPETEHVKLPDLPEPVQIEIELTSNCNARCTACPRSEMPVAGLMREETIERIIAVYKKARSSFAINSLPTGHLFPSVVIAGGGEPVIHPMAGEFIQRLVQSGFKTHLITNGSRFDQERIEKIVRSGISTISVSFWGVEKGEYEAAMKLPFETTLLRVRSLFDACREAGIPLQVVWVRSPEIKSSDREIQTFWDTLGIPVDLTDPAPWNRGGLVGNPRYTDSPPGQFLPDPSRRIWCADLFFSDSYRWNGDCILCCCNFFKRIPLKLGNVHENSLEELAEKRQQILNQRPIPAMCQVCELPRAKRAEWLAGAWLDHLSPQDREMLIAGDDQQA